ncbi:MAG: DUF4271 domain-containing protein, partial [Cyclobacteriaceae bacterium]
RNEGLAAVWFILSFMFVALARYFFPVRFKETIGAAWEQRYFNYLERETGVFNHWVPFLLFLNFLFTLSLLLYQSFGDSFKTLLNTGSSPVLLLLYGFMAGALFFGLKFGFIYFTSWIFRTDVATDNYLRHTLIIYNIIGIILLPLLIVNFFNTATWLTYGAWAFFALLEAWRLLRIIPIGLQIRGFSTYHLILYLCAVEIIPVLLIVKYAQNTI